MLIREDREKLIEVVNEYIHDEITAFEFDDKLFDFRDSKDKTVSQVASDLWNYYDDCIDHKIVASKKLWDYLQRILLLLESDGEAEIIKRKRWHYTQLFALILFAISIGIFIFSKNIYIGMLINTTLWPFSYLIYKTRCSGELKIWKSFRQCFCYPYKSAGQLLRHRRSVPYFKKEYYPKRLNQRIIRSKVAGITSDVTRYVLWIAFCPLVLLFQVFPLLLIASIFQVKSVGNSVDM